MSDAILWCGILISAGSVASVVSRSIGLPVSSGALFGSLAATWMAGGWLGWSDPDPLGLVRTLLLSFLCFLLGAEIDLAQLVRGGAAAAFGAAASSVAVLILVWGAAVLAGIGGSQPFLLAAAAAGASPAATIALTSELRARGEMAQRLLIAAPAGLLISIIAIGTAAVNGWYLAGWLLALVMGAACGFVVLVPLSRLSSRGAILTCAGAGSLFLTGAGAWVAVGEAGVVFASIVAGLMAGNLTANRDAVRDALRDLSLPATITFFAIVGAALPALSPGLIAAALLVASGRVVALVVAGFLLGRREGIAGAAALTPIALLAPGLIAAWTTRDDDLPGVLAWAVIATQLAGPIVARWSLIRTGAASTAGDPDAWREAMR